MRKTTNRAARRIAALRLVIRKALMDIEELETRAAYARWPDTLPDACSPRPKQSSPTQV